jgi:HSP20 family protein
MPASQRQPLSIFEQEDASAHVQQRCSFCRIIHQEAVPMSLVPWQSIKDIEDLLDRTSDGMTWPLACCGTWQATLTAPRVDIFERDGAYVIEADVPGVARDDLHVSLENGVLTIRGERHQEKREQRGRCHRLERFDGSFLRSFTLPMDSDGTGIRASCQDGQLSITVPRKTGTPASTALEVPVQ